MENEVTILVDSQFGSFAELSELAVAWNADFRQISAERLKSMIFQAKIGSILISNGHFGCHVTQRGETPAGMRTFAMLARDSSPMMWFGQYVDANALLIFPKSMDIDVHSRPGFKAQTFSVPEELLSNFPNCPGERELRAVLNDNEHVLRIQSACLDQMRVLLQQAVDSIRLSITQAEIAILSNGFEEELLSQLGYLLFNSKKEPGIARIPRNRVLTDILDYIEKKSPEPLTVVDLTKMTERNERTLRNYFQHWLGMSPKAYMLGKRLAGANLDLWRADPYRTKVSDVASKWGFWHMGQFASDYKRMFNELPSTTLKHSL